MIGKRSKLASTSESSGNEYFAYALLNILGRYPQFTAEIEGLTIHFVHKNSTARNAIPLILFHGWPGSFLEFLPLIDNLTKEGKTSNGKSVSFDVIIPNLPGFGLSSAPPGNWTNQDTARVFNTLMTDVLGYKKYATHGTDWGCATAYDLYDSYNSTVRATHLASLPFVPLTPDQLAAEGITLDALEMFEEQSFVEWSTNGYAYFQQETTKVTDDQSVSPKTNNQLTAVPSQIQ